MQTGVGSVTFPEGGVLGAIMSYFIKKPVDFLIIFISFIFGATQPFILLN